ncbi:uncharacterized protein LOC129293659 [Prosopis cineraria]|uniref:uncharacterized protein LOC129293659 n=1 Tax=Prosopis cineraria TaxID=364024 RepID=UPI00240EB505|nr:uncharacterized protein LOC129293659 [Prosopis cineraria]
MGKEWYWTGRSSKRGEGAGADAHNPSGCMCAFFQFFDFHPLHFPIQQQHPSDKPEDRSIPKGAEAPRNSLESEDGKMSFISKEEYLKIPKRMQIKTSRRAKGGNGSDLSSEISNSPCTKTPTLVARLMGLDLLPDAQSPSLSCISTPNPKGNSRLHRSKPRQNILTKHRNSTDSDIAASRSLPETPRISSARRSDVDHHRFSLQINKENLGLGEDLELPRLSFLKRKFEEQNCRSPSHYARHIVKQVRESVSRKVGLDITNTVKNREQSRAELVGQIRVKKSPKASLKVIDESSPGKNPNPPSSSPRLRFMEAKQKTTTRPPLPLTPKDQNSLPVKLSSPPPINVEPQIPRVLTKSKPQAFAGQELQNQKSVPKCKKDANERFSARLRKPRQTSDIFRNKKEESFVRPPRPSPIRANDTKRTSNLLNLTSIPNLRPVNTDSSPPKTKIPQKQPQGPDAQRPKRSSQLSSCPRQTYKQEEKRILATREANDEDDGKSNGASTTGARGPPEFEYVTNILSRTTEGKEGARNQASLDPPIFHHLEQYYYPTSISTVCSVSTVAESNNQLGLRCNRKLLFDLVDELLGEIVRPWVKQDSNYLCGSHALASHHQLMAEAVCKRIRSFPEAHCEVLEDIDALIEREDLGKMMREGLDCKEAEEEGLVEEIEWSILQTLVHEAVVACSGN